MVEEKKSEDGRKVGLRIKPIYAVDKDTRLGAELNNANMYLFKNGKMVDCPFRMVATRDGLYAPPCGEDCQHFHYQPETKKIRVDNEGKEVVSGGSVMEEKIVETGKIFVRLTCGCGGSNGMGTYLPISNIDASTGTKMTEAPASKIISLTK